MSNLFPFLILALLLVGMVSFSRRNKARAAAADSARRAALVPGAEVMTTSGLYGTVVAVNTDDSVLMSIAPGVEVKWTAAALREIRELPPQYQAQVEGTDVSDVPGTGTAEDR